MKSVNLPIYQRQSDVGDEVKGSFFFSLLNNVPYIELVLGLIGFLFGRATVLNGLMPFGISYFSIFLYQKNWIRPSRIWSVALGVGIGYLSQFNLISIKYIVVVVLLLTIKRYITDLKELTYSLIIGLTFLVCQIPEFIFTSSIVNLFSLFSEVLIVFFITLLGLRVLPELLNYFEQRDKIAVKGVIISCLIVGLFISGLPVEEVANINLIRLIGVYLIMLAALIDGSGLATMLGASIGFLYSISHLEVNHLIGSYALAGLIAGKFKDQNKLGVVIGFILSNLVYVIFITKAGYITLLVQEAIIAGLILLLTPQKVISSFEFLAVEKQRGERLEDRKLQSFISERIGQFSEIFNELFSSFSEVSTTDEAEVENIGALLDLVTDKVCRRCDLYSSCWKQSFYNTYNSLFNLLAIAENTGEVTVDDLEQNMVISCTRKIKLATAINQFVKMYELNNYWQSRLENSERILLDQLSGMSQVVDRLADELTVKVSSEQEVETKVQSILENNGIMIKEILATNYNDEELEFTIRRKSCNGKDKCVNKMIPLLNGKLDFNLEMVWNECGAQLGKSHCLCQLAPKAGYQFEAGVATSSQKDDISGDNYTFFEQKEGKFVTILSDGMGVGSKASQQSGSAVNLLQKMLQAGLDYELALHTVNSTLGLRSTDDTFATIDLLSIDQATGEAEFVKVGSASSFIKRGADISMVKSTTLPVGILSNVEIEPNSLQLEHNDLIIMMTDGVLDSKENLTIKEEWILKVLKNNLINDPQSLAQYILEKAQADDDKLKDDMTVLVIKVDKC